jgi:hypothetical protein
LRDGIFERKPRLHRAGNDSEDSDGSGEGDDEAEEEDGEEIGDEKKEEEQEIDTSALGSEATHDTRLAFAINPRV